MSIFRKLLEAFLLEDGAPSIFAGLLPTAHTMDANYQRERMNRAGQTEAQVTRAPNLRAGARR